jgi:hypothetical protein
MVGNSENAIRPLTNKKVNGIAVFPNFVFFIESSELRKILRDLSRKEWVVIRRIVADSPFPFPFPRWRDISILAHHFGLEYHYKAHTWI